MSSYEDYRDFILEKLDERTLLEQLAEEASELSQAALKLIRATKMNNNFTPKTEQEAIENLVEEVMDCNMVSSLLYRKNKKLIVGVPERENKCKRWAERLGYND